MNIEFNPNAQAGQLRSSSMSDAAESVKRERAAVKDEKSLNEASNQQEKKAQQEELLQNIKALTEEGIYSVRFEVYKETNDMVINLIEQESGEVIRQIPPEEILGMRETLASLRGNLVEKQI